MVPDTTAWYHRKHLMVKYSPCLPDQDYFDDVTWLALQSLFIEKAYVKVARILYTVSIGVVKNSHGHIWILKLKIIKETKEELEDNFPSGLFFFLKWLTEWSPAPSAHSSTASYPSLFLIKSLPCSVLAKPSLAADVNALCWWWIAASSWVNAAKSKQLHCLIQSYTKQVTSETGVRNNTSLCPLQNIMAAMLSAD